MSETQSAETLTLGVFSEVHLATPGTRNAIWHNELRFDLGEEPLERAVGLLVDRNVDAIAMLGDLTNSSDIESLSRSTAPLQTTRKQVFLAPGNHDITSSPNSLERFGAETASSSITPAPWTGSFRGFPISVLGLERDPATNRLSSVAPPVFLTDGPLQIVLSHYPLLPMEAVLAEAGLKHAGDLTDLSALSQRLLDSPVPVIVLHGHLHVRAATAQGPVLHLSFAALVEPPHECSVMKVEWLPTGDLVVHRQAISVVGYDVEKLPVLSPENERWRFTAGTWSPEN